jgi:hypothetical protein
MSGNRITCIQRFSGLDLKDNVLKIDELTRQIAKEIMPLNHVYTQVPGFFNPKIGTVSL